MITEMTTFTLAHVLLSLIGIVSGLVVLSGLCTANAMNGLTLLFLAATATTTVTGFLFPFNGFTPALGVGIVSLTILAATISARYNHRFAGAWRGIYVVGAVAALYLNSFVLVAQLFLKVPSLHALAPNGTETTFAVAQTAVLAFYLITGFIAVKKFHPDHARS
jgi:hypothetical protein